MRSWEEIGTTRAAGPWAGTADTPCRERRLFYHYNQIVYVEFAAYGDVGVVTCADDNGGLFDSAQEAEESAEKLIASKMKKGYERAGSESDF